MSRAVPAACPSRSLLFVPGDRPERFDKAAASGAHDIVLDLEDAVAPAGKAVARGQVADWLAQGCAALVRINDVRTAWHASDLRMLQDLPDTVGVMLPKADVASLEQVLPALPGRRVIALLETVDGYMELPRLVRLPRLERIAFGSVDFSVDSGVQDEGDALAAVRVQIVLHSRHAGLAAPVDGVSVNFDDDARMRQDALQSRRLGFGGKLCIHPRQVQAVNTAFLPTPAEQEWAQRVIAAFTASGGAATALDGKMIDKPVVDRAQALLAQVQGVA